MRLATAFMLRFSFSGAASFGSCSLHFVFLRIHGPRPGLQSLSSRHLLALILHAMLSFVASKLEDARRNVVWRVPRRHITHDPVYEFLVKNKVPADLCQRVEAYFTEQRRRRWRMQYTSAEEVWKMLPRHLLLELRYVERCPILSQHPFFNALIELEGDCQDMVKDLCLEAISVVSWCCRDVVFTAGQESAGMYFIKRGALEYSLPRERKTRKPQHWFCEAALWSSWRHTGTLRATEDCEIMIVDADKFNEILARYSMNLKYASCYAQRFLDSICGKDVDDLSSPDFEPLCELTSASLDTSNSGFGFPIWPRLISTVLAVRGDLQSNLLSIQVTMMSGSVLLTCDADANSFTLADLRAAVGGATAMGAMGGKPDRCVFVDQRTGWRVDGTSLAEGDVLVAKLLQFKQISVYSFDIVVSL